MVKVMTMNRDGSTSVIKEINPERCPHFIFMQEHYRNDGTCHCDDPTAEYMIGWGYTWRNGAWRGD